MSEIRVEMPRPFLQRHLEEFQMAMEDFLPPQGRKRYTPSVYRGAALRAAVVQGWVHGLEKPEDVGNLPPWQVTELAEQVLAVVVEAVERPKDGS